MKHYWERWRFAMMIGWLLCVGIIAFSAPEAKSQPRGSNATATWYGPGFYGNGTACGHRYTKNIRGVAVPSGGRYKMRCGTKLTVCYKHRRAGWRCRRVRVIDTGGFRNHRFDLSSRTARNLCKCWRPYTMKVVWRRGWSHR